MPDSEGRHTRRARHAFLSAHVGKSECIVENVQVVSHGVAAPRVHDSDRDAGAVKTIRVERTYVICGWDRLRGETSTADCLTIRIGWRCFASRDELKIA